MAHESKNVNIFAVLLLVALRQFRGRPHQGEEAPLPKWMGAIDRFHAIAALA